MKEVKVINSYNDSVLGEFVNAGTILKVTEERAEELINAKVAEELVIPEEIEAEPAAEPTEPVEVEEAKEEAEPIEEATAPVVEDEKAPEAEVEKATLKDKSSKKNN